MILSSEEIRELIESSKLVEGCVDLEKQLQQSGIDLTLEKVFEIKGTGRIDFDNTGRKFPETIELNFNRKGFMKLKQGVYKVKFNEIVHIPSGIAAIAQSRSSILRMGAMVETALWDPGFEGKSESMLVVLNKKGIEVKKNARLIQLIFFRLSKETNRMYEGIHKNIK